jgi:hypothetical protein
LRFTLLAPTVSSRGAQKGQRTLSSRLRQTKTITLLARTCIGVTDQDGQRDAKQLAIS